MPLTYLLLVSKVLFYYLMPPKLPLNIIFSQIEKIDKIGEQAELVLLDAIIIKGP